MKGMTAQRLRVVLFFIMVLIMVAAVVGFSIVQKNLASYATSISKLNADAQSGDKDIRTLKSLKTRLAEQQELIQKTRAIVGDASSYADTVINDISQIGTQSEVQVKSIAFAENISAAGATGAPLTAGTPTPTTAAPSGVTKKTVTVSIASPLSYTNLMKFLSRIETNQLRMHVTKVTMTKDTGNDVATQDLTIEVYVRQ